MMILIKTSVKLKSLLKKENHWNNNKVNYFKDLSPNMGSFLFIRIFKREFYIRYYEENNSTKRNIMASKLSSLYVGRKLEDFKKVYEIACKELEDETHQAMEALVHNFNTLVYIGAA